ncbi:CMRF35-like molecule 8 isoform X3 [Denticeps clupeoides]|uniref:CMRF35-like molecule 8 isoform X3 n=1 Tax=Denticeps clupeoides TaxID=299321 RepID=UPI0010A2EEEA|nr:CMRF35-like molecule 8 isoform X3 [Denticeps clupeoides]
MDVHQGTAKYLCKYYRSSTCEYKLSTSDDGAWVQSEKLALHDSRHQRTFTVTMNNLSRFDTGTYWCGVASDWESGGYRSLITKVHLTVTEPTVSPPTVTSYLLTKPSRSSLGEAGGHFAERETCKTWSHPGHAAPRPSTSLTAVVGVDPTASSAPESGGHHSTALRVFVGLLVLLIISTMLLVTLGIVKRKKSGGRAASLEPYTPEKIQLTDGGKTHQASPEAQI